MRGKGKGIQKFGNTWMPSLALTSFALAGHDNP